MVDARWYGAESARPLIMPMTTVPAISHRFPYPDPDDVVFKRDLELTQAGKRFRVARGRQRDAIEHLEGLRRLHSVIPWTPAARASEAKWRCEYHDASTRASRALDVLIERHGWPLHGTYDATFTCAARHDGIIQQQSMRLAQRLIEAWCANAQEPAGEDTAGRQMFRPLTPLELVTQACKTADLFAREAYKRGWINPSQQQGDRGTVEGGGDAAAQD